VASLLKFGDLDSVVGLVMLLGIVRGYSVLRYLFLIPLPLHAAAVPEYVKVEHPGDVNLKGLHTATESIGGIPESLVNQYEMVPFLPGYELPKWLKVCQRWQV